MTMGEVRFSRTAPWCCPSYGEYYIQDKFSGKDIYGNDTYEYALFRRKPFQVIRRFRTRKQAYMYVSQVTGLDQWDIKMGSHSVITNNHEYLGVIHGDIMYRISKKTREVAMRPVDNEQLTGWHMKYIDCLSESKALLEKDVTYKTLLNHTSKV